MDGSGRSTASYTPWQRELLQFILEYRNAVMSTDQAGLDVEPNHGRGESGDGTSLREDAILETDLREGCARARRDGRRRLLHTVGMAVHDVGRYAGAPLKPGQVFSIDPQLRVPEENLYLRYEDTVVVTESGVENFTDFLPSELADMERLVRETGVVQTAPAIPQKAMATLGRRPR